MPDSLDMFDDLLKNSLGAAPLGGQPDDVDADPFGRLTAAIRHIESRGKPGAVSKQGATGSMQIMPGTFKQYALPGEDFGNDTDRTAAAVRKLRDDYAYYGGDVRKTAAAYIGGRGGVRADGSLRDDRADAEGTTPRSYADMIEARMGGISAGGAGGAAPATDMLDEMLAASRTVKLPEAPKQGAGFMRTAGDVGIKLAQGAVGLGQSVVGASSLATGGLTGRGMRAMGYDPRAMNEILGEYLSDDQKAADAAVQGADGFVDAVIASIENPRSILGGIAESAPGMLAGMGLTSAVARGIAVRAAVASTEGAAAAAAARAAGKSAAEAGTAALETAAGKQAAEEAIKAASTRLLAVGSGTEGAQSAGQIADDAQANGRAYGDYAVPAVIGGATTAAIGIGSGKIFGDAATDLATGARTQTGGRAARIAKGIISEGPVEEGLQSYGEQVATNFAQGEPDRTKGAAAAAGTGSVIGGLIGGGMAAFEGNPAAQPGTPGTPPALPGTPGTPPPPPAGPLTRAANAGTPFGGMDPLLAGVRGNDPAAVRQAAQAADPFAQPATDGPQNFNDLMVRNTQRQAQDQQAQQAAQEQAAQEQAAAEAAQQAAQAQAAQEQAAAAQQQQAAEAAQQQAAAENAQRAAQDEFLRTERLKREADMESLAGRLDAQQAAASRNARADILDAVLSELPSAPVQNKLAAFKARLEREGYRQSIATPEEIAHVQRHAAIADALNSVEQEPAAPNELVDAVPERQAPAKPAKAAPVNTAAVDTAIAQGMRLVSPSGRVLRKPSGGKIFKMSEAQKAHYLKVMGVAAPVTTNPPTPSAEPTPPFNANPPTPSAEPTPPAAAPQQQAAPSEPIVPPRAAPVDSGDYKAAVERVIYNATHADPFKDDDTPLSANDLTFELEVMLSSAEQGKLTPERFAQSAIGQRADTATLMVINKAIRAGDAVGVVNAMIARADDLKSSAAPVVPDVAPVAPAAEQSPVAAPAESAATPAPAAPAESSAQAKREAKAAIAKEGAARRKAEAATSKASGLRVGKTPTDAVPITVEDGVIQIGGKPALDYENGDPVTIAQGATNEDIAKALEAAGSIGNGNTIYGRKAAQPAAAPVAPAKEAAPEADQVRDATKMTAPEAAPAAEPAATPATTPAAAAPTAAPEAAPTAAAEPPAAAPQAEEAAPAKALTPKEQAKADFAASMADFANIIGANLKANFTPEQERKIIPVMVNMMDAAFRMGYYSFKDAANFVIDSLRTNISDEVADQITLDQLQGSYIAMSGKYQDQGADSKKTVINDFETLADLRAAAPVAQAEPATTTPDAAQEASAPPAQNESSTVASGGSVAEAEKIAEKVAPVAPSAPGMVGALEELIRQETGIAEDWASRAYKQNKTQIELKGDGPSNNASLSVNALNESRRNKAIEAAANNIRAAKSILKKVGDNAGYTQFMRGLEVMREQAGTDAAFEYAFLDSINMRPPGGRGSITSNSLSRAVLAEVKREQAKPKQAEEKQFTAEEIERAKKDVAERLAAGEDWLNVMFGIPAADGNKTPADAPDSTPTAGTTTPAEPAAPAQILNEVGKPFTVKFAADTALKKQGLTATHEVVSTPDGYVGQLKAAPVERDRTAGASKLRSENEQAMLQAGAEDFASGAERAAPAFMAGESRRLWLEGYDAAQEKASKAEAAPVPAAASAEPVAPKAAIPEAVRTSLSWAIGQMNDVNNALKGVERARGNGEILALEWKDQSPKLIRPREILAEFRVLAPKNGVDAEQYLNDQFGGEPDFSQFESPANAPAAEPASELPAMAEGDRINFVPFDPLKYSGPIEGMAVQIDKTGGGNLRIKISTDDPAPQGGGFISRVVYSQDGTFTNLSAKAAADEFAAVSGTPVQRFEKLRAAGDGTEQSAITALRKVAGRSDDTDITFWNRWQSVMGSNRIKAFVDQQVVQWMEKNLIQEPWTGRLLPGVEMASVAAKSQGTVDYWTKVMAEFERRNKDFAAATARMEGQARDVEEMGGSAAAVAKARDAIGQMYRQVATNEREIQEGLQAAKERERTEEDAEQAVEAASYKSADLGELAKKPTAASLNGWYKGHYEGRDTWTNGALADLSGEPHLADWRNRVDPMRRDANPDMARVVPKQMGDLLAPFGQYDHKSAFGTGTVYFQHDGQDQGGKGEVIGVAKQFVQYFLSKYKGAQFHAGVGSTLNQPVMVMHDGKLVGIVMPIKLAAKDEPLLTVADIQAKIAAGDQQRATVAAEPKLEATDRDRLREQLKSAKFVKGPITIKEHSGNETVTEGYTFRGLGVHQVGKSNSGTYRVTHLNTGMRVGPDYRTMTDAKLAAARMGQVTDMDAIKTEADARRDGQDPTTGFGKVAKIVSAMRGNTLDEKGDPLAKPELSLPADPAAPAAPVAAQPPAAPTPDTREAIEHNGTRIYPITLKGEPRWAVQSPDNKGTERVGGDRILTSLDDAKKEADLEAAQEADKAKRVAEVARNAAEAEAVKEANRGKSLEQRRADATLDKPTKLPLQAGLGTDSRRKSMEMAFEQGRAVVEKTVEDTAARKRDENTMATFSRSGYMLTLSNPNIPIVKAAIEANARLKAKEYAKPEYRVYSGSSAEGSFYEISKTEYDYAKKLIADAAAAPAVAEQPAQAAPADQVAEEGKPTEGAQEPWEMTLDQFTAAALAKNEYRAAIEQDDSARASFNDNAERDWRAGLDERAKQGRIPDAVLDDVVARYGFGYVASNFRGVSEPGADGYLTPDVRNPVVAPKVDEVGENPANEIAQQIAQPAPMGKGNIGQGESPNKIAQIAQPESPVAETSDTLTEAQATAQTEWRDLGQRDGEKKHILIFKEKASDLNGITIAIVRQIDGGQWQAGGNGQASSKSFEKLKDAKKMAAAAGMDYLREQGYVTKGEAVPAPPASAEAAAPTQVASAEPESAAPAAASTEPWQLTRAAFLDEVRKGRNFPQLGTNPTPLATLRGAKDYDRMDLQAASHHESAVTMAVAEGKAVPADVLADYPTLLPVAAAKQVSAPAAPEAPLTAKQIVRNVAKARPFDKYEDVRDAALEQVEQQTGKKWQNHEGTQGSFANDPLSEAIREGQYAGMRAYAATLPVRISESSIPREAANQAFSGTSFSPEKRGASVQRGYLRELVDLWRRFRNAYNAAPEDRQAAFVEAFDDAAARYASLTNAYLASHSRVMSSMIAGPARFPTESNRKKSEAADKRAAEADEFLPKAAKRLAKVLRGALDSSVSSELKEAESKLAAREKTQAQYKIINAALRKGDDQPLRDMGLSDDDIAGLKKPDFGGRTGIPDYKLTNNNAEIRRLRVRVEELKARAEQAEAATEEDQDVAPGVRMVRNAEANRLQLFFDGKPSEAIRTALKAAAFKWSPTSGAWQRQLTDNAAYAADEIIKAHAAESAAAQAPSEADQRLAAEVADLPGDEQRALEEAYGEAADTPGFLSKLQADVAKLVNDGAQAVASAIRNIVQKIANGVMAVALVFNPNGTTDIQFDLEREFTRTSTVAITAAADKTLGLSPRAQATYELMAPVAIARGKAFILADKPGAQIHAFDKNGKHIASGPALFGKQAGDVQNTNADGSFIDVDSMSETDKITPTGAYVGRILEDDGYAGKRVLMLYDAKTGEQAGGIAVHAVWTGNAKEQRLARLASTDLADKKISFGCVNTADEFFLGKVLPLADQFDGGLTMIVPEQQSVEKVFEPMTRDVTETGTERQSSARGQRAGDLVGKEEQVGGNSGDALMGNVRAPGFYSELARQISTAKQDTMPAPQWASWLAANAAKLGIKKDEIEWSGINEYLELRGKDKVSKADLAAYLDENGVQVEEVQKGAGSGAYEQMSDKELHAVLLGRDPYAEDLDEYFDRDFTISLLRDMDSQYETGKDQPKYGKYQLAGGNNYRELLLTLPQKGPKRITVDNLPPLFILGGGKSLIRGEDGFKIAAYFNDAHPTPISDDEAVRIYAESNAGSEVLHEANLASDFRSKHWDEGNVVAHVRFNDRVDADGNKTLFIEELQSDWNAAGRKEGFGRESMSDDQLRELIEENDSNADTEGLSRADLLSMAAEAGVEGGPIALAPFVGKTDGWLQLGIKRMIMYASANGYDKIAFINGQQSADRYDLSKQIGRITFDDNSSGGIGKPSMDGEPSAGMLTAYGLNGNEVISKRIESPAEAEDVIGKEAAQKLFAQKPVAAQSAGLGVRRRELAGLDLKVGGNGMRVFYDQIVPQNVNDVLKKLGGGKIGTVLINTPKGKPTEYADFAAWRAAPDVAELNQPGFTITDTLREKATAGLPMFATDAQRGTNPGTAFDQSLHADIEAGATARDLLTRIANESTDPGNRAIAAQMLENGVDPTVSVGSSAGQTFNTGRNAADNAASYDPKRNHVSLYDVAGAERNLMHEFTHAGTAKALRANGKSALQMKSLYADVKRSGKLAGMYGISNVDEFVAEAHSNKAFQAALKAIPSGERSMWDRFVDIVRSVLGMAPNQRDMLAQVLEAGRGLMAENSGRAEGAMQGTIAQTATKAFKDWFEGSKIVDGKGMPLRMYHGTRADVSAFAGNRAYFTADPQYANGYAEGDGGNVVPVYLSAKKPLDMTDLGDGAHSEQTVLNALAAKGVDVRTLRGLVSSKDGGPIGIWAWWHTPAVIEAVKKSGFDSVIQMERTSAGTTKAVVTLDPTAQVKSATGNSGAFDRAEPSIMGNVDGNEKTPFERSIQELLYQGRDTILDADDRLTINPSDIEDTIGEPEWQRRFNGDWQDGVTIPLNDADTAKVLAHVNGANWFHGSKYPGIEKLELLSRGGLFITSDIDVAKYYAASEDNIYELKINVRRPFFVATTDTTADMESSGEIEALKEKGYDAIVPLDYGDLVVLSDDVLTKKDSLSENQPNANNAADNKTAAADVLNAAELFAAQYLPGNEKQFADIAKDYIAGRMAKGEKIPAPPLRNASANRTDQLDKQPLTGPKKNKGRNDAVGEADQAGDELMGNVRDRTSLGDLSAAQRTAADNVLGVRKTLKERAQEFKQHWKKNLVQGVFDQFAPIKELSEKAYIQSRMTRGGDSTLEALMMYGKVVVDSDGYYQSTYSKANGKQGFAQAMAKLNGEHDRFFLWVAAQRASNLASVGLENLFSSSDIAALKTLDQGAMKDGTARGAIYAQGLRDMNDFNDSVLKIAEDSGLIDTDTRKLYKDMPYIPFYRLQDEGIVGFGMKAGIVNQSAWKKLKGGTDKLNEDLMSNLLQNWSHLITASAKNRAAKASLDAAVHAGVATQVPSGAPGKGTVAYREDGKEKTFMVSDPHIMDAISALEYAGLGPWSKPLTAMKRMLTIGVTVNPAFKIRNLIRDSVQAIGSADLAYNPLENIKSGWMATADDSETRAQMLASGGMIRFGSMLDGNSSQRAKDLINSKIDQSMVLSDDNKVQAFWKGSIQPAIDAYQELGDRGEQVNRAALYERLLAKGMSHGEASFWARDLMDFSSAGKWQAVRFLTQVVPFMNARLQGLYKLGRAGKQDYKRLSYVTATVALASIALLAAYHDDDDWKKREDFDRQNYWWFKVAGVAIRIPKPFEIGAIGTIAEMGAEYFASDEMTGKRFMQNLGTIVGSQLSMNPIPQLVKPMLDVYANKDSFTKRPIESMAMQRLQPKDRFNERTFEVSKFLGSLGLPDPIMLAMGHYEQLSPVKIDALTRGYFGWLGTMASTAIDYGIRPMIDQGDRPARTLRDAFLIGNFAESLPSNSSRYVSQMYDQANAIEQAYASYHQAQKQGDTQKAQELLAENRKEIAAYRGIEALKRRETAINATVKRAQASKTMSADEKRAVIDAASAQRDKIARLYVPL